VIILFVKFRKMKNALFNNFSYVAIGRIIASILVALFFLIFAALLEPDDFGKLGYLIALAGTFAGVARFGLPQTVVVYLAKKKKLLSDQVNLLAIILACVATIILIFINEYAAFLCLAISFFFLYQHNLLGDKKYKRFLKSSVLRNLLTFVIPFPLYFVLDIPGILLGMALGNIISSVWLVKSINFKIRSFQELTNNYKVLINNFGIDASSNLIRTMDRLLVGIIFGFLYNGIYIFNMQILLGLEILPRILYLFLLSEESSGRNHKKINYFVVFFSGLSTIIAIIFAPFIIEQIFPKYSDGIIGLQVLVISLVPISISSIITAKLQAVESTKVGYSSIVSIGSLLILLGLLGNEYGIMGLSLAVVISSILTTIFLFYLYRNFNKEQVMRHDD